MNMAHLRNLLILLAMLLSGKHATGATYTFDTIPVTGERVAFPGQGNTNGWGYTITNLSTTDWLVTTGVSAGPFAGGTANAIFDFPVVAPGATVSQAYRQFGDISCGPGPCGLYEFTWDLDAPINAENLGTFVLSAEWWTGDPLSGGQFITGADDTFAEYRTQVIVPEPVTVVLAGAGLAVLWLRRSVRVRRSSAIARF